MVLAAMQGKRNLVDKFHGWGVPVNRTNQWGVTPLLKSADYGYTEMVEHLLRLGAQPNIVARCEERDCRGHTALMWAAAQRDLDMAKTLLAAGADPHIAGDAAIETAHRNGDVDLYLLLQQYGGRERQPNPPPLDSPAALGTPIGSLGLTQLLPSVPNPAPSARRGAKPRLAIIAEENYVLPADLLTAQLSSDASLELIERQELDRVLNERKLTRHFASETANYGRVAELLRADALLLIRRRELAGQGVVESRLLRVNPGLVLDTVYSPDPIAEAGEWAQRTSGRLTGQLEKATRPEAIALSLLSISSSVRNAADRGLERTLAVLLSDRLAHQPHFLLLERAAMEKLTAENAGKFWTGSYLVDGNVESALDNSGVFKLSLRLLPSGGGAPLQFSATGRRASPSQVIDQLVAEVNAHSARVPKPVERNLAEEAQRYAEEAEWALATDQAALAQRSAEAAWALGSRSIALARLRVLSAIRTIRDVSRGATGKAEPLGKAACLDLAQHQLDTWRDTLDSEMLRGKPAELHQWLEFGAEAVDGALAAATSQLETAGDRVAYADRLTKLRETLWECLCQIRDRSKMLPAGNGLDNFACEKQSTIARFVHPTTAGLIPAVRELLARSFPTNNALSRARIRINLANQWENFGLPAQYARSATANLAWRHSRGDDARRQLIRLLRDSSAPEDQYLAAVHTLHYIYRRSNVTSAEIEPLCSTLLAISDLLAEGGEIFSLYFGLFDSLDKRKGVPFFAMTQHQRGIYHVERHTAEHSQFRAKLFLAIAAKAKKPDEQFTRMLNRDDFPVEQQKEIADARIRLEAHSTSPPPKPLRSRPPSGMASGAARPAPGPAVSAEGAPALRVRHLWHPFKLGLNIPAEFTLNLNFQWLEEKLWLYGYSLDVGGQADRHLVFAVDPQTGQTDTYELPERGQGVDTKFLITPSHLLVSLRGSFVVYDRAQKRWNSYKEIAPVETSKPILIGDRVYLSVVESPASALISLDLTTRSTDILVSQRRRPALSPFDGPEHPITGVRSNELGELVVSSHQMHQAWSPQTRTWRVLPTPTPAELAAISKAGQRTVYSRVGAVRQESAGHVLRLNRKEAPAIDIPLTYVIPNGAFLPVSRYHSSLRYGQNIAPSHANSFAGGLLLTPGFHPSGFWIVTRPEIDEYLQKRSEPPKSIESVAK